MLDVIYQSVNQLQYTPSRFPSLRRQGWGLWIAMLCRRPLGAAVLAAAIFILAVLTGPHLIEHLLGKDGDPDHCAVCAAVHGMRAGALAATVVLVPALLPVGPPTLKGQPPVSAVAIASPSPRGPPVIG